MFGDLIKLSIGGSLCFFGTGVYRENEKFYDNILMPFFRTFNPETAHQLAIQAAKYNLVPKAKLKESKILVRF